MKFQILFSWKNKKSIISRDNLHEISIRKNMISLSSAEIAKRVAKVK